MANNKEEEIESGLDFIISHFEEPLFPRKISTFKSNNKQFLTRSRQEIVDSFIDSDFVDCKINAYPYLIEYKGIQRYKPDFLFIDLDKNNFKTGKSLEFALYNTLKNIKNKLNGYPTVLFTGGGYHVYQPVYIPTALEYITEFSKFDKPSEQFLRFAKDYLSNGKADKQNNPSFRSCLLRIPGSINSKYHTQVKIIKKWNGFSAPITLDLLEEFRIYLIQIKVDQAVQRQKILNERRSRNNININYYYYEWVEHLLQTPIEDFRKLVVDLILAPYLINVKKLSYEKSFTIINDWLQKCDSIRKLDFNTGDRVNAAIKNTLKKQIPPMSFITLKNNYRDLYFLILQNNKKEGTGGGEGRQQ